MSTSIERAAPAERAWNHFTDFESYFAWNPFIRSLQGEEGEGSRIEVALRIPERDPMAFRQVVLAFERNRVLEWEAAAPRFLHWTAQPPA
ncbi:MAG: SRPBCC family protein [Spirochaetes bacterium]|nr:SRPBCC family protein [Spirochaetota bacterium]